MTIRKKIPRNDQTIFSPAEACGYMGLSWTSLRKLINDGEIRAVRVGRRYLISKENIDNYMNRDEIIARSVVKSILFKRK